MAVASQKRSTLQKAQKLCNALQKMLLAESSTPQCASPPKFPARSKEDVLSKKQIVGPQYSEKTLEAIICKHGSCSYDYFFSATRVAYDTTKHVTYVIGFCRPSSPITTPLPPLVTLYTLVAPSWEKCNTGAIRKTTQQTNSELHQATSRALHTHCFQARGRVSIRLPISSSEGLQKKEKSSTVRREKTFLGARVGFTMLKDNLTQCPLRLRPCETHRLCITN